MLHWQVLRALIATLPCPPHVSSFMMDFEAAQWKAVRRVFPDATMKGCCFHYGQAVWRKIQQSGLQTAYTDRKKTHSFLRYAHTIGIINAFNIIYSLHKLHLLIIINYYYILTLSYDRLFVCYNANIWM